MKERATEINDCLCKYLNCNYFNACESNRKCSICWIGRAEKTTFDSDVIDNTVTSSSLSLYCPFLHYSYYFILFQGCREEWGNLLEQDRDTDVMFKMHKVSRTTATVRYGLHIQVSGLIPVS